MNKDAVRQTWQVLTWVTACMSGYLTSHPGHPSMGRHKDWCSGNHQRTKLRVLHWTVGPINRTGIPVLIKGDHWCWLNWIYLWATKRRTTWLYVWNNSVVLQKLQTVDDGMYSPKTTLYIEITSMSCSWPLHVLLCYVLLDVGSFSQLWCFYVLFFYIF